MNNISLSSFLDIKNFISFEKSFELAQRCSALLGKKETEDVARDLIIRILELYSENKVDAATIKMWNDLVEAAGLHPYVNKEFLYGRLAVRHEIHQSQYLENIYLHEEQFKISQLLLQNKSVVLSAPTSFGKSLLIEEIIASGIYKNIVIVQPTLALLDETRKKLKKYQGLYQIVVSTHQMPSQEKNNIFLFTGERVVEYQHFPKIDFFVIDEFYKLSIDRGDERTPTLNHAFYRLLQHTDKFYLLGPNINQVSFSFLRKYYPVWHCTNYTTVAVDVKTIKKMNKEEKLKELFEILRNTNESTIIYCSSPEKASQLAENFTKYIMTFNSIQEGPLNGEIIDWIIENVHKDWILAKVLRYGIAFHHSHLPRHLGSSIVDAFNQGAIKFLFCTSTLIEGVNTRAKNIVLFDNKKGKRLIDHFDYKNIIGRAGRMNQHFVGQIYTFYKEPEKNELNVEIPLFDQNNAPPELLIHLKEADIQMIAKNKLQNLEMLDDKLKEIVKSNAGLSIERQIELVKEMQNNLYQYHSLLSWTATEVEYHQLEKVIELCWIFFFKKNESNAGIRSHKQLTYMVWEYYKSRSLSRLISAQLNQGSLEKSGLEVEEFIQKTISKILAVNRLWFEFKLPKWLAALSKLQEYIYNENGLAPGNYNFFAAQLENNFFNEKLSVLLDYDVPASAIKKLETALSKDALDWEGLSRKLHSMNLEAYGLLPYEISKIRTAVR